MKKGMIIFLSILIVLVVVVLVGILSFKKQYEQLMIDVDNEYAMIDDFDLSNVTDGEYSYRFGRIPVIANVKVIVKDNKITSITMLEQTSGPGYEALDVIDRILARQQPDVEAVTGATTSSKVIMIAVKKALTEKEIE